MSAFYTPKRCRAGRRFVAVARSNGATFCILSHTRDTVTLRGWCGDYCKSRATFREAFTLRKVQS